MLTRLATRAAAVAAAAVLLAACSLGGDGSGGDTDSEGNGTSGADGQTPGGGPEPYLPVPDGVVLTDPGSELGLGEQAVVAWRPGKGDDDAVGVLGVKVRKLVKADMKDLFDWQLDAGARGSSLYYVTVTVANIGDADLSGLRVPLYVLDDTGALVESSSFKTDFDPCPSLAMPDGFVTGEKATLCQAYLVPKHGDLQAAAFRANRKFNPITWVGKVTVPRKPKKKPAGG